MDRRRILQDISDVLKRAGFHTHPGDRGLVLEAVPGGVLVGWRPDPELLHPMMQLAHGDDGGVPDAPSGTRYGNGIKQAMATAVAAVLEQAGFQVRPVEAGLEVTDSARTPAAPPAARRFTKAIGHHDATRAPTPTSRPGGPPTPRHGSPPASRQ